MLSQLSSSRPRFNVMTIPSLSESDVPDTPRQNSSNETTELDVTAETQTTEVSSKFPIVGIGASAGGLEAISKFLTAVPVNSGMAFVVVQHLDPTQVGHLPELLQRCTAMPVATVVDQTHVEPNSVYVIPPDKDMSILNGNLYLLAPVASRGFRLPIDFFFERWPTIDMSSALASYFLEWDPMERSVFKRSKRTVVSRWLRSPSQRNLIRCRRAQSTLLMPISSRNQKRCRSRSSST